MLVLVAGCGGPGERNGKIGGGMIDEMPTGGGGGGGGNPDPMMPMKQECTYPAAPYGKDVGKTVSPTLMWQGYVDGATTVSTVTAADLYDCDGEKKIDVIVFSQAAQWCGVCKSEASKLEGQLNGAWASLNVKFVTLVIENSAGSPATTTTAKQWRDTYGLNSASVMADPAFTFAHPGSNSLPVHAIVDPRTMKIVDKPEGSDPIDSLVKQIAAQNQK